MKTFFKLLVIIVGVPVVLISAWLGYVSYQLADFRHPLLEKSFEASQENDRYANEVLQAFALELESQHKFFLNGFHVEKEDEKIHLLQFEVTAHYSPSLEDARALELTLTERLIEAVNGNEKLRPFLKEYPVTNQTVSIHLRFHGSSITSFDSNVDYIHTVPNSYVPENRDRIFYYGHSDPFGSDFEFSETFEEAKSTVSAEINPYAHQSTEFEEAIELVGTSLAENLDAHHKLCKDAIVFKKGEEEFRCHFTLFARADQEKARKLLVASVNQLMNEIGKNKKLQSLLKADFQTNQIKLKISFRKNKAFVGRVCYTQGIDEVVLENNEITFYPVDPDHYPIVKEPLSI
jgi:hypothetical protein